MRRRAVISVLVPFVHLNDMIDAGVLLSLNMTNACVILLRRRGDEHLHTRRSPGRFLAAYCALAFVAAFSAAKLPVEFHPVEVSCFFGLAAFLVLVSLAVCCPEVRRAVSVCVCVLHS